MFHSGTPRTGDSVSVPEAMAWVYFCATTYAPEDFVPAVRGAAWPPPAPRPSEEWREWRNGVWAGLVADQHGRQRSRGMDPDDFDSLAVWPELQQTCRVRWPGFVRWWRTAKPQLVETTTNPATAEAIRSARPPDRQPLRIHVVALAAAQDLAGSGSDHLVSAGLIADPQAFRRWLAAQD